MYQFSLNFVVMLQSGAQPRGRRDGCHSFKISNICINVAQVKKQFEFCNWFLPNRWLYETPLIGNSLIYVDEKFYILKPLPFLVLLTTHESKIVLKQTAALTSHSTPQQLAIFVNVHTPTYLRHTYITPLSCIRIGSLPSNPSLCICYCRPPSIQCIKVIASAAELACYR